MNKNELKYTSLFYSLHLRSQMTGGDNQQSDGLISSEANFNIPCCVLILSHQLCVIGFALLSTKIVHSLHLRNEPLCVFTR